MADGAFLVKRISCGTTSDEDRCSSVSAVVVEGLMNEAPAAAYSAEVATSATKAGSYGVFGEGE